MGEFSGLDGLGRAKSILDNKPDNPLAELLEVEMNRVIDLIRFEIEDLKVDAGGNLKASIGIAEIDYSDGKMSIAVNGAHYWKYINYGVNGLRDYNFAPDYKDTSVWGVPPPSLKTFEECVKEWIIFRDIRPEPDIDGNITEQDRQELLDRIMAGIMIKGKKRRPFVDNVVNENLSKELSEKVSNLVGRAIEVTIKNEFI